MANAINLSFQHLFIMHPLYYRHSLAQRDIVKNPSPWYHVDDILVGGDTLQNKIILYTLKKVKQGTVFKSNGQLVGKGLLEGDF